ncbi:MAG: nucleotidyltransferase family protein [Deltaproteobacteria bacterium]|nr:nucleotidyltransferase family protein [Deltaproteobacteria bacterium]
MRGRVGGIVLAAGASTRAGCPKALATIDGETLVGRATRVLTEGGVDQVVVVVGPPHGEEVGEAVRRHGASPVTDDLRVLQNDDPGRGMLSSLKVALSHGVADAWDGAVVVLVDQPRVRAGDVSALLEAFRSSSVRIVRVAAGQRRGHPYLVARSVFAELLAAPDDLGPRPVLTGLSPAMTVDVGDPRVLDDVDTPADLAAAGVKPPL